MNASHTPPARCLVSVFPFVSVAGSLFEKPLNTPHRSILRRSSSLDGLWSSRIRQVLHTLESKRVEKTRARKKGERAPATVARFHRCKTRVGLLCIPFPSCGAKEAEKSTMRSMQPKKSRTGPKKAAASASAATVQAQQYLPKCEFIKDYSPMCDCPKESTPTFRNPNWPIPTRWEKAVSKSETFRKAMLNHPFNTQTFHTQWQIFTVTMVFSRLNP